MITGTHVILYSRDADADRVFFRDVLKYPSVDAGDGWLIFALPPAEIAIHPADADGHEMYLMCDDVDAVRSELQALQVACSAVVDRGWGRLMTVTLPGGGSLGIYEPRHPVAAGMS